MIMDRDLSEMSVLERQQAVLNWQQGQLFQQHYTNANDQMCMFNIQAQAHPFSGFQGLDELVSQATELGSGWGEYGNVSCTIPRTVSCPTAVAAAAAEGVAATMLETPSSAVGRESSRKRRIDKTRSRKVNTEEEPEDKKIKASGQEERGDSKKEQHSSNKNTTSSNNSNKDHSADTSKENSKVTDVQKPDYIHVRARRGQATDSHSLAERVRREKISERMKYLQDIVPGCSKIVGKAGMLDEIINYVQSLQKQVEFLSMKLAAVNPTIDFNTDDIFTKEIISTGTSNFSTFGLPSEMANPLHLQHNPLQQIASCSGMETIINPPDMALRRTISAPVTTIPETLLDQSCFNQIQHSTCDADLQNLYAMEFQQGKSASFFSHPFAGYVEAGHVKLQM